jgi:2,4-dienoyl-CoA reductase-like NADH-dependent reductase (Old Yellow Enzyme family)
VHGANGYLITQFLDSTANGRTDKWGGSIENRSRFGLEVLKALVDVFGRNVALKLSPSGGYNDVGWVKSREVERGMVSTDTFLFSMPLQETLDTYRYFISEADKLNLSYITLVRYVAHADVEIDGE